MVSSGPEFGEVLGRLVADAGLIKILQACQFGNSVIKFDPEDYVINHDGIRCVAAIKYGLYRKFTGRGTDGRLRTYVYHYAIIGLWEKDVLGGYRPTHHWLTFCSMAGSEFANFYKALGFDKPIPRKNIDLVRFFRGLNRWLYEARPHIRFKYEHKSERDKHLEMVNIKQYTGTDLVPVKYHGFSDKALAAISKAEARMQASKPAPQKNITDANDIIYKAASAYAELNDTNTAAASDEKGYDNGEIYDGDFEDSNHKAG